MQRIRRAHRASSDLEDLWLYVARDNVSSAERLLDRIEAACQTLSESPGIGRSREEFGAGVKSFPVERYMIYYRLIEGGIEIARVLHGARDLSSLVF